MLGGAASKSPFGEDLVSLSSRFLFAGVLSLLSGPVDAYADAFHVGSEAARTEVDYFG